MDAAIEMPPKVDTLIMADFINAYKHVFEISDSAQSRACK